MEQGELMLDTMGQRLTALQRQREWSNKDVTELLKGYGIDIDPSHYSRLVNDKSLPSVQVAIALAKLFETTIDFVLGMEWATDEHRIVAPDAFITNEANAIGVMLDRMDVDMRKRALHIVGELLEINDERRNLHADIAELLGEQINLLSGQKRQQIETLLGRLFQ